MVSLVHIDVGCLVGMEVDKRPHMLEDGRSNILFCFMCCGSLGASETYATVATFNHSKDIEEC